MAMMNKQGLGPRVIGALAAATLAGCASGRHTLPRDGASMQAVYDRHFSGELTPGVIPADSGLGAARLAADRSLHSGRGELDAYTRTAWNETQLLFAELPNPAIVVYIDPHLSESGYPVPGYTTATRLYPDTPYALPGEVPPPARPVGVREPGL